MEWFRTIVMFITLIGFLQWVTPNSSMEKYVKYIFSLLTLAVILSPLYSDVDITAALELPVGAVAAEGNYENSVETVTEIQTYQIRELLTERIVSEVKALMSDDFPDISKEDIEVYIQQESLKQDTGLRCIITIRTENLKLESSIRQRISDGLGIPDDCVRVLRKETSDE